MRLIIIGAGGHGKVAADCAEDMQAYDSIIFLDSKKGLEAVNRWPVCGLPENFEQFVNQNTAFFVAIGHNVTRQIWLEKLAIQQANIATLIHPSAVIGSDVKITEGSLLLAQTAINIDSHIGAGCIVNTGATIDHDCVIGQCVHIAPGTHLAGNVQLGDRVFSGIGSAIVQGINVGDDCVIGAGATVIDHLPASVTAVGTPARIIKTQTIES